ncbi:MAG: HAMP domain-containing sensor histidine kinase, partial [Thermodesulfobacteriota bacterium]
MKKTKLPLKTLLKIGVIGGVVGFITLLHYQTAADAGIRHVIFRELYFLPIILGGFWFGLRGGLLTALAISLLYGPLILSGADRFSTHNFGNTMEILLFYLIGGVLGWLKDRETAQEARARQVENLAAMGQAAAMIAHDLKTPLITIGGFARQLSKKISADTPEAEKVVIIRQQSERLEKLVMDILFFAKPMELSLKSHDFCNLLNKAKEAASQTAHGKKVKIDIAAEKACDCYLDYDKMMQVFINLFTNAIEASPQDETVSVSLHHYTDELIVDVSDRGIGVSESTKDKIFEPFVTGKKKGTGLGLPISKKIV